MNLRETFKLQAVLIPLLLLLFSATVAAQELIPPQRCLECHGDVVGLQEFANSVHGRIACTGCHTGVTDLEKHPKGETDPTQVQCARCHKPVAAAHYASIHMARDVDCSDCHTTIHSLKGWKGNKERVVNTCGNCHSTEWYRESVHGEAVEEGNRDSAACHDCHNLHEIRELQPATEEYQEFQILVCMKCHADEEMMRRNGVYPLAVDTYMKSYHGTSFRLGYPIQVAECADCHTAHAVLPETDPQSSISPSRIVETCGQCHRGIDADFTEYHVHGTYHDPGRYPGMFWTFVLMTALVVLVFAVFWTHTLLWMFRGFVENREKERALAEGRLQPVQRGHVQYYRFRKWHIFLHLTVIVSFLGLSVTGLPLKFAGMAWARAMMSFYGGVQMAGFIHRICAGITFFYFFAAVAMSIHFLFLRRDIPGNWIQRLFGPDSLMFNRKDLQDVGGMMRWFFFRGEKPIFERWSYWEKFDFFAVFWGMFAIGGSGLLLWFSETSGSLLGGWVLNLAEIVHSDEALLATGFIFTVHFFNTHARPEKFPMDYVIFNGQISRQDFIEERGAQWDRYEQEGTTEKYRVRKGSGIVYDLFFRTFGFAALLTGIFLAFLMIYAFLRG